MPHYEVSLTLPINAKSEELAKACFFRVVTLEDRTPESHKVKIVEVNKKFMDYDLPFNKG